MPTASFMEITEMLTQKQTLLLSAAFVIGMIANLQVTDISLPSSSYVITQALALEGKITVPRLVPPQAEFIAAVPQNSVDYFRVRIYFNNWQ